MKTKACLQLNGKKIGDCRIDGVDTNDYPDFCDTYFCWATFEDGTELTDDQLEELTEKNADVLNEMAHEHYI